MKINILKNKADYPVIKNYEKFDPAFHYDDGESDVTIYILKQDGIWCSGISYNVSGEGFGGRCAPGRKWGEWDSYNSALEDSLKKVLARFEIEYNTHHKQVIVTRCARVIKAINRKLIELKDGKQTELF